MIKIYLIKTNKECFISDCSKFEGYDYNYHNTKLNNLFFDGEKAKETYAKGWLVVSKYPKKITRFQSQPSINKRYEISNIDLVSAHIPQIIPFDRKTDYEESIIGLYKYQEDKQDDIEVDVEYEIEEILQIENFETPHKMDYSVIKKKGYEKIVGKITNNDIKHQFLDKIIFPSIVWPLYPCSISSQNLYSIIRNHIKENIDLKVSKITSDYDFCFTVKKIIPLIEPIKFSYKNFFASTKKQRNKTHYGVAEYKEVEVFEMTHTGVNYKSYTPIKELFADNENDLKSKIDELLDGIMATINKPLVQCPNCNGTGYKDGGTNNG